MVAPEPISFPWGAGVSLGFRLYFYKLANAEGLKAGGVGLSSFHKFTKLKTAKDRFVVTPNNVTIDAYALFDVSKEPVVVRPPCSVRAALVPRADGRLVR
jgi:hypothetical protein